MSDPIYSAQATVTGNRHHGHGRTSDGTLDVQLRSPGEGEGTNPEQLFAVGYAACFANAIGVAARRARLDPGEISIDARVHLYPPTERRYALGVELHIRLPGLASAEEAVALVTEAHRVCPYSNATRGNIPVGLTANGHPVDG